MIMLLDTSDEWIKSRTGIRQRFIADKNQLNSDLGYEAAKKALKNAKIKTSDIDLIIVATSTPDHTFPSTATKIQAKLGIKKGFAFDSSQCSYHKGLSLDKDLMRQLYFLKKFYLFFSLKINLDKNKTPKIISRTIYILFWIRMILFHSELVGISFGTTTVTKVTSCFYIH